VEQFFLRFFTDGTGIQYQQVSFFRKLSGFITQRTGQQIYHFGRVILVHLAAPGFDMQFLAHGCAWPTHY
jgi:hypothetical protein